jgi:hypothetical protein
MTLTKASIVDAIHQELSFPRTARLSFWSCCWS